MATKKTTNDKPYMTDEDFAQITQYGKDYNSATTDAQRQAAHDAAEELRAKYAYSGGVDGSDYISLKQPAQSYQSSSATSYTNQYQSLIDKLSGQIVDRPAFSYNYENDPLWAQLQKSYSREGERAMQDTLGQVAGRTGGMASSYAASAANQANNYQMAQLNDKIPELEQLAYSMYQDDVSNDRLNLQMIQALEQGDYTKYLGLLDQFNTDRSYEYQLQRDQIADGRYDEETAYDRNSDRQETAYNQAMDRWKLTGTVSAADAAVLGVPAGTGYEMYQAASSGGGSGSSGQTAQQEAGSGDIYQTLYDTGARDYGTAYGTLITQGYGTTTAKELATYFAETYLGSQQNGGESGGTVSEGANRLYQQLNAIPGLTEDNKLAMVEDALNSGKITDADAEWLMGYLGY